MATRVVFVYSPDKLPQLHQWLMKHRSSSEIREALCEHIAMKEGQLPDSTLPSQPQVEIELDDFGGGLDDT